MDGISEFLAHGSEEDRRDSPLEWFLISVRGEKKACPNPVS